jgi:uncharacterized protein (TIGR03032 family)
LSIPEAAPEEKFALTTSRRFPELVASLGCSIAFSTYQAGKLFLLGLKADGRLAIFERTFPRCMGIGVHPRGRSFALATEYQIVRFDDILTKERSYAEHDAVFSPHMSWFTGDVDAHDVAWGLGERIIFANTLFSCLAATSDGASFRPLWQPRFISKLAPEDRCHLNGVALENGVPRFASVVAASDVTDGWRDQREAGGLIVDVASGETIVRALSMPHSPRLYDGKLWVLNSGSGEFGYVDSARGRFEGVAFCPGYARGLAFAGRHALIGLSLPRENRTFQGLSLDAALASRGAEARCGLLAVDIDSGDTTAWVRIEGVVRELYDVAVLPGVRNPAVIGFKTDEIRRLISIEAANR